jgi:sulfite reductase (ferredoxin)
MLSKTYGTGVVHVTTRQDLQIHGLRIQDTPDVLESLLEVGLSPRGGGGNTVRNITACPRAGICPEEEFDVSGHSVALSEYLLQDNSSFNLPRKFKIAFSGCSRDCAFASVADLGFFAHRQDGINGFAVYAGGGLGSHPQVGIKIEGFIPSDKIFHVSEAVKKFFDKHGDRGNKHRARLRYVLMREGEKEFKRLYRDELYKILYQDLPHSIPETNKASPNQELRHFVKTTIQSSYKDSVMNEKTTDFYTVRLRLRFGDIPADDLQRVAHITDNLSEGIVRTTQSQNLLICSVSGENVERVLSALEGLSIDVVGSSDAEIVTCTGAATCKLGLCLSRGLAEGIIKNLSGKVFPSGTSSSVIRISGCPNSCGHHYIANIGLQGKAKRIHGKLMPFYEVFLGAVIREGKASLAEKIGSLPAKSVPSLISDILETGPSPMKSNVKNLIDRYNESLRDNLPSEYFYDFGTVKPFSLAGRGPGECGAGVMDLIRLDIDEAKESVKSTKEIKIAEEKSTSLYQALVSIARALLIIYGLEPQTDREIFNSFNRHLIEPGWVNAENRKLINAGMDWRMGDRESIVGLSDQIEILIKRIEELFHSLDANLNFKLKPIRTIITNTLTTTKIHTADLRGVICPLNFVKAKIALEKLNPGEILEILLDEGEPVRNVPASFQDQGQDVLEVKKIDGHFCVKVRRRN